jgi:hypothetical protein
MSLGTCPHILLYSSVFWLFIPVESISTGGAHLTMVTKTTTFLTLCPIVGRLILVCIMAAVFALAMEPANIIAVLTSTDIQPPHIVALKTEPSHRALLVTIGTDTSPRALYGYESFCGIRWISRRSNHTSGARHLDKVA